MTKEIRNSMTGKKLEAAASAPTPIILPRNTVLNVPDRDCRMFASIIGPRNSRKTFQTGFWVFTGSR